MGAEGEWGSHASRKVVGVLTFCVLALNIGHSSSWRWFGMKSIAKLSTPFAASASISSHTYLPPHHIMATVRPCELTHLCRHRVGSVESDQNLENFRALLALVFAQTRATSCRWLPAENLPQRVLKLEVLLGGQDGHHMLGGKLIRRLRARHYLNDVPILRHSMTMGR